MSFETIGDGRISVRCFERENDFNHDLAVRDCIRLYQCASVVCVCLCRGSTLGYNDFIRVVLSEHHTKDCKPRTSIEFSLKL